MKTLLLYFLSFYFTISCFSQTSFGFSGVDIEIIPMNPQTGQYNYFGVKLSVKQTYDQNITINGYIFDSDGYNTNHSFSLTILAGELTAQTELNFYQTGPTTDANATTSSISPTSLTSGGITYNTQNIILNPLDFLNAVGQLHNDLQSYLFTFLISQNIDLLDTTDVKQIIESKTQQFFNSHGVNSNFPTYLNFSNTGNEAYNFNTSGLGLSYDAVSILNSLKSLIINYDPDNDASFFNSLNSLQSQALNLSDQEVYNVGIPVTVAIYSFNYWKSNADSIKQIFDYQDSIRNNTETAQNNYQRRFLKSNETNELGIGVQSGPNINTSVFHEYNSNSKVYNFSGNPKINLWKLGGADVSGALGGAIDGAALGPGGALAGGILGSSVSSSMNLLNQIVDSHVSWWPF